MLGGHGLDGRPDDAIEPRRVRTLRRQAPRSRFAHGPLIESARHLAFAKPDEDGTAIGAGLELIGVQRVLEFPTRSKIVVLLTDGESNVHDFDEDVAIRDAVKAGVKVYTIGAGPAATASRYDLRRRGPARLQMP